MELKVLEENNKKMVFELAGEGHTMLNALKHELWGNKHVKVATYNIKHPLIPVPKMIIETDGEVKPRKVLLDAIDRVRKDAEKFGKDFAKEMR